MGTKAKETYADKVEKEIESGDIDGALKDMSEHKPTDVVEDSNKS